MLFKDEKFGAFIHWGIYSVGGWQEQEMWRKNIKKEDYVKIADEFNPTDFDIDSWLTILKNAGMQYICFTAKHHDGFCMWDTAYTDFNIMNTPYNKDILFEVANGCKRHKMKLAIYYSCPDWNHKNSLNFGGNHELEKPNDGDEPNEKLYIEYIKNQMRELLSGKYGKISALFWDIPPKTYDSSINELVRSLMPDILINDRGYSEGDYKTPERGVPEGEAFKNLTEACQSFSSQSWGYRADDDYFSRLYLMESIDKIMSRGGNYLLNFGPDSKGNIPQKCIENIEKIGKWYQSVKESYYADFVENSAVPYRITRKGNALYLHFDGIAVASGVSLKPIDIDAKSVTLLNTGEALPHRVEYLPYDFLGVGMPKPKYLHINNIPVDELSCEVIVLKIEFDNIESVLSKLTSNEKSKLIL